MKFIDYACRVVFVLVVVTLFVTVIGFFIYVLVNTSGDGEGLFY